MSIYINTVSARMSDNMRKHICASTHTHTLMSHTPQSRPMSPLLKANIILPLLRCTRTHGHTCLCVHVSVHFFVLNLSYRACKPGMEVSASKASLSPHPLEPPWREAIWAHGSPRMKHFSFRSSEVTALSWRQGGSWLSTSKNRFCRLFFSL